MTTISNYAAAYRQEAEELLAEVETTVLELEENPQDQEAVNHLFRVIHTIKGSGAMFGFERIAKFTHHIESLLDKVREGHIPVTKKMIDLVLVARDRIKVLLGLPQAEDPQADEEHSWIIAEFEALAKAPAPPKSVETEHQAEAAADRNRTYRIRFHPHADICKTGIDPALLLNDLQALGECHMGTQIEQIPNLDELNPQQCYLYWDMILSTARDVNQIRDVFIFVEDQAEIKIDVIDQADPGDTEDTEYKRLGEILMERGDLDSDELGEALRKQKLLGKVLVEEDLVDQGLVDSALAEQKQVRDIREKRQVESAGSSIRVAADKLDNLVNLVGELVTVQARLSQAAFSSKDPELLSIAEAVEHMTAELRDNTMSIRMLPIGTTFSKFKRVVRDLSNDLGKEINLTTEGGETELDKTVIEQLNDPLMHIIRNCVDHAIELPEVRQRLGKPSAGTILLSASHSGANVLIKIADDGAGLNMDLIRAKAVEKGLIGHDAELTKKELHHLIFHPGFSTAAQVTGVSGRGVGMDVVKRGIENLRGSIEIESEKGKSTTIVLKLPLTLAIIDGLMVDVADDFYIMPLSAIEECIELTRADVAKDHGRHMIKVRDRIVPYLRLREIFSMTGQLPEIEQIVIAEVEGERMGFVVDHIKGQHQTVIKNLGKMYHNIRGVSGATILGDGTVALILDLPQLVQANDQQAAQA